MRVKAVLRNVQLVIADVEVSWNGKLQTSSTLCAIVSEESQAAERVIPLNTPDGRPILMNWDNAMIVPK
jgi:hypothetical protein